MNKKLEGYFGFAARSRNLCSGYNTCLYNITSGKLKLLIITEGISENSRKKLVTQAEKKHIDYRFYGDAEEISRVTGNSVKQVFGLTDRNFANMIREEIDKELSLGKEVF